MSLRDSWKEIDLQLVGKLEKWLDSKKDDAAYPQRIHPVTVTYDLKISKLIFWYQADLPKFWAKLNAVTESPKQYAGKIFEWIAKNRGDLFEQSRTFPHFLRLSGLDAYKKYSRGDGTCEATL